MRAPTVIVVQTPDDWSAMCLDCPGMYLEPLDLGEFQTKSAAEKAATAHRKDHKPLPCPTCGHVQPSVIDPVQEYTGVNR